jgi:type II secretory pathway pseudopilin PulG
MDDLAPRRSRTVIVITAVTAIVLAAAVVFAVLGVVATADGSNTRDEADRLRDRRLALAAQQRHIEEQRRDLGSKRADAHIDLNQFSTYDFTTAADNVGVAQYAATLLLVLEPTEGTAGFRDQIPQHVDALAQQRDGLRRAIDAAAADVATAAQAAAR